MSESIQANVAIIGAGPAGTAAAAHLGQLGVRNVVLVDRADFPRDKTCGSGISPKGIEVLRELGVWRQIEPEAYWIKGIRIVTPGGYESVQSAGSDVEAIICHRRHVRSRTPEEGRRSRNSVHSQLLGDQGDRERRPHQGLCRPRRHRDSCEVHDRRWGLALSDRRQIRQAPPASSMRSWGGGRTSSSRRTTSK